MKEMITDDKKMGGKNFKCEVGERHEFLNFHLTVEEFNYLKILASFF